MSISPNNDAAEVQSGSGFDVYVQVTGGEVGMVSSLAPKIRLLGFSPRRSAKTAKKMAKD